MNTKSKFYKPLISLLVALILVFSFEVNKPKAIVPILLWGGGILAGMVAEEVVEMGIRHATGTGATSTKSKTKKIADAMFSDIDEYDFDFLKTNPKRKADGSLEVYPSANDRAKIAREIADEFGDIIDADNARRASDRYYDGKDTSTDPFFQTSVRLQYYVNNNLGSSIKGHQLANMMYSVIFEPLAYEKKTKIKFISVIDGSSYEYTQIGGSVSAPKTLTVTPMYNSPTDATFSVDGYTWTPGVSPATLSAYNAYLTAITVANTKVYFDDGMAVPETIKNVYPAPRNMKTDYQLPNNSDLSNKPFKLKDMYPVQSDDSDITWETVNNDYDNDTNTWNSKVEQNVDTYLENGDIVNNTYNTQTINNYYTDTNYPVKSGDIDITVIVKDDTDIIVPGDGDDGGTTVHNPHVEHVEELNQGMFAIMKNSYDYLGDSLDNALLAMKDVTDDATGLIVYLDTAFDWLPSEWRALFGSAFVLGIFAHFFRR